MSKTHAANPYECEPYANWTPAADRRKLKFSQAVATIVYHGMSPFAFMAERTKPLAEPVTLGELRDWLGC